MILHHQPTQKQTQSSLFLASGMLSRHIVTAFLGLFVLLLSGCLPEVNVNLPPEPGTKNELVLATTTSTYDSGLLDYILPDFQRKTGITVRVLAVGTGQALALGEAGDADVLLVHAREREDQFVADGYAPSRHDVMYNDFVIVGPATDPAGIKGVQSATEALTKIADAQATFVSRGDDSGTHIKEKQLWKMVGITPQGDWYESAGQGMGAVLTMANEQQAYTMSDRGTYLARLKEGLDLEIMVEEDPPLFNPYGVLPVTPDKEHDINYGGAIAFINWITSDDVQEMIGQFGLEDYDQPLFFPNAK